MDRAMPISDTLETTQMSWAIVGARRGNGAGGTNC
jgi:hypothetical protein